jgi:penicillin-binding protein 1A
MSSKRRELSGCLKVLIFVISSILVLVLATGGILVLYYLNSLPTLEELTPSPIAQTSKVYAFDGSLLTEFHAEENREIISFHQMSQYIKDAIVAVEDKRFYEHEGVDYIRIIGAFIEDVKTGELSEGASTITMQYIKNVYFTPEKTFRRKINEALISIQLERNYTKDKILEMYLNTIYFGSGTYGIQKASKVYFGVDASELTLPQAALLAGLVRIPEVYSPFIDIEKSKSRRDLILQLMYDQGYIDTDQYLDALAEPVIINKDKTYDSGISSSRIAPYFIDYVKQNLYDKKFTDYDVFKGGLRIYTTLDTEMQEKAEDAVKKIFPEDPEPSYSLVSVDPDNGYIYALIGGKDYSTSKFNIATQGKRQPGSVFKTLVLIESILQNFSPKNTFNPNGPITIDMEEGPDWEVHNYNDQTFGVEEMSVVDATIHSVNVVYSQLIMKIGAENVENLCNDMEIFDVGNNPSIAIGGLTYGITPLDLSNVFSTLASGGVYRPPVCILKITDYQGNILYEYDPDNNESIHRVFDEPVSYHVTQILEKVIESGTGKGADIGRPAAGKTGTTENNVDAWFAGYTPDLVTVVWMGHPEASKPMEPINGRVLVGGTYPADIWREFMSSALENIPISDFKKPEKELIDIEICADSGLLTTFWCPEDSVEWQIFIEGQEPKDICDVHNKVEVPDVVGKSFEESKQILEDLYFVVEETHGFNEIYNKNIIFKQKPGAGEIIESLTGEKLNIILYISKGKETFDMPDLSGLEFDAAEEILKDLGLIISDTVFDFSDEQPADFIFDQDPVPGSKVSKSDTVIIYISKGENPQSTVPDVLQMTEEDAIAKLNSEGFEIISAIYEESTEEIDLVFSQTPVAGTVYEKTQEVIIKISLGVKVPDVIDMTREEAELALNELGFEVEILPYEDSLGNVISQVPEADQYLNYGSTVTIEISEEENGDEEDGDEEV